LPTKFSSLTEVIGYYHPQAKATLEKALLSFIVNPTIPNEGTKLEINQQGIVIEASDYPGALYGFYQFMQMNENDQVPFATIEDEPDLKIRGYMLDISRDKIPTVESLKSLIRVLSIFHYNHFELYIEGFAFQYDHFPSLPYDTPLTKSDYLTLEQFANTYGIDLVPNMNGFGHMMKWLALDEYRPLAEKVDGSIQWGYHFPASTINPLNPDSFELVKTMITELLEIAHSPYFHLNCDEPFELGLGESKEACEQDGKAKVYLDYVNQLKSVVESYHKTPLIWGDVLINHPEAFQQFPKSLIICDWGYDAGYPFEVHAKMLEEENVPYILSPGTSSWNSFTSRLHDMKVTSKDACLAAKKHHGLGVITTDWGDFGHIQYSMFSVPGIAYAGTLMWSEEMTDDQLTEFVNKYVFNNEPLYADIVQLAHYSQLENQYIYNGTMAFQTIMFVDPQPLTPIAYKVGGWEKALQNTPYTESSQKLLVNMLEPLEIKYENANTLLTSEMKNAIKLLKISVNLHFWINQHLTIPACVPTELDEIIEEHQRLWLLRNKLGGLDRSLSRIVELKHIVQSLLLKS